MFEWLRFWGKPTTITLLKKEYSLLAKERRLLHEAYQLVHSQREHSLGAFVAATSRTPLSSGDRAKLDTISEQDALNLIESCIREIESAIDRFSDERKRGLSELNTWHRFKENINVPFDKLHKTCKHLEKKIDTKDRKKFKFIFNLTQLIHFVEQLIKKDERVQELIDSNPGLFPDKK